MFVEWIRGEQEREKWNCVCVCMCVFVNKMEKIDKSRDLLSQSNGITNIGLDCDHKVSYKT